MSFFSRFGVAVQAVGLASLLSFSGCGDSGPDVASVRFVDVGVDPSSVFVGDRFVARAVAVSDGSVVDSVVGVYGSERFPALYGRFRAFCRERNLFKDL